jgi:hypothetical protein
MAIYSSGSRPKSQLSRKPWPQHSRHYRESELNVKEPCDNPRVYFERLFACTRPGDAGFRRTLDSGRAAG